MVVRKILGMLLKSLFPLFVSLEEVYTPSRKRSGLTTMIESRNTLYQNGFQISPCLKAGVSEVFDDASKF